MRKANRLAHESRKAEKQQEKDFRRFDELMQLDKKETKRQQEAEDKRNKAKADEIEA